MLAKVYVTLKSGVLDPQGTAIHHSVELMGAEGISNIRQGKYFEIRFDDDLSREQAESEAEKIARDVLANPVIEDFRVEFV
ncbi:MAG: phosphoribosylformylglycinamidine synthase subunit PurS [Pyrinomonadaceae bacterium]